MWRYKTVKGGRPMFVFCGIIQQVNPNVLSRWKKEIKAIDGSGLISISLLGSWG